MTTLVPLNDFSIGKEVRVVPKSDGKSSRRGIISCINDDAEEESFDVIFQAAQSSLPDEENSVQRGRLFDILPFEAFPLASLENPAEIKDYANRLFQIQDYDSAYKYYVRAHKLVQQDKSYSVGQRVIISLPTSGDSHSQKKSDSTAKQRSGMYICVTVSDLEDHRSVDVMFDSEVQGRDEEDGVPTSRVLLIISSDADEKELQRSLLMNLAKCSLKLIPRVAGWACYWASLAVAFVQGELEQYSETEGRKRLCDAYFVKCKAMLAGARPVQARKAAAAVQRFDSTRGQMLTQDIDKFLKQRQKQNKALAKNVAEWIDQAMTISSQLKEAGSGSGGGGGAGLGELENDLDIEDFDDGEEEEEDVVDVQQSRQRGSSDRVVASDKSQSSALGSAVVEEEEEEEEEGEGEDAAQCTIQ